MTHNLTQNRKNFGEAESIFFLFVTAYHFFLLRRRICAPTFCDHLGCILVSCLLHEQNSSRSKRSKIQKWRAVAPYCVLIG